MRDVLFLSGTASAMVFSPIISCHFFTGIRERMIEDFFWGRSSIISSRAKRDWESEGCCSRLSRISKLWGSVRLRAAGMALGALASLPAHQFGCIRLYPSDVLVSRDLALSSCWNCFKYLFDHESCTGQRPASVSRYGPTRRAKLGIPNRTCMPVPDRLSARVFC